MDNLRQVGLGTLMYANDYDDRLPEASRWSDSLMPYTKNKFAFRCPLVSNSEKEYGYAYEDRLSNVKTTSFKRPEKQIVAFDSADLSWNAHSLVLNLPDPPRHNSNNACYVDGHAKAIRSNPQ